MDFRAGAGSSNHFPTEIRTCKCKANGAYQDVYRESQMDKQDEQRHHPNNIRTHIPKHED